MNTPTTVVNAELARYVTGASDLCQVVTVEQRGPDAFVVTNYESCDGDNSPAQVKPFTVACDAFRYALALVADEVADLIDGP